jgi:hypothetical protein
VSIPTSEQTQTRIVLNNVLRVGYDVHLCPFPGSLCAVLEYLGQPQPYDYIMGVTGAPFRRLWNRDDGGNIDLSYLGDKPFQSAFDALGYEWKKVPAEKDAMLAAIHESLARGVPPISFGIIGPPEAGVVTGYDPQTGAVMGWSYFQGDYGHDRNSYYEKRDWFETMDKNAGKGLIVIGAHTGNIPAPQQVLKSALEWAIDLACTPRREGIPGHVSGLAAYEGWAADLEVDADYPADNTQIMQNRSMVHGDACVMLEERAVAASFLRRMKEFAPPAAAQHLEAAAKLYEEARDVMWKLWTTQDYGMFGMAKPLGDPATRREIAQYVRVAGEKEGQAVAHLQQALAVLK